MRRDIRLTFRRPVSSKLHPSHYARIVETWFAKAKPTRYPCRRRFERHPRS